MSNTDLKENNQEVLKHIFNTYSHQWTQQDQGRFMDYIQSSSSEEIKPSEADELLKEFWELDLPVDVREIKFWKWRKKLQKYLISMSNKEPDVQASVATMSNSNSSVKDWCKEMGEAQKEITPASSVEIKRPIITNYFKNLDDAQSQYLHSPGLFGYTLDLDLYTDELESQLTELEKRYDQLNKGYLQCQAELKEVKEKFLRGVDEWAKQERNFLEELKYWKELAGASMVVLETFPREVLLDQANEDYLEYEQLKNQKPNSD